MNDRSVAFTAELLDLIARLRILRERMPARVVSSLDRLHRLRQYLDAADAELVRLISNFAGQKRQGRLEVARRRLRDVQARLEDFSLGVGR